jgi:hypothetical protein
MLDTSSRLQRIINRLSYFTVPVTVVSRTGVEKYVPIRDINDEARYYSGGKMRYVYYSVMKMGTAFGITKWVPVPNTCVMDLAPSGVARWYVIEFPVRHSVILNNARV